MAHGDARRRRKQAKQRASTLQDSSGRAETYAGVVARAAEQRHEQGLENKLRQELLSAAAARHGKADACGECV